jgi:hypothetical protein
MADSDFLEFEQSKDPDDVKDYLFDWSAWLGDEDTIETSTFILPAGLTADSDSNTTTTATIWISGGTIGNTYKVLNRIVTAGGRTMDRTALLVVAER